MEKRKQGIRLVLADTSLPGIRGSMLRYADLVEKAVSDALLSSIPIAVTRICLAFPHQFPRWIPSRIHPWLNHAWIRITGTSRIRRSKADLVHVLDGSHAYLINGSPKYAIVATVHDLIPLLQQQGKFGAMKSHYFAQRLIAGAVQGLKTCNRLIAVSASTARDLFDIAGIPNPSVTIITNPLEPLIFENAYSSLPHSGLPRTEEFVPYILHLGNNSFYKNRLGALRIFAQVFETNKLRLVLAGPSPTVELLDLVETLGLKGWVEFVIDPDDKTLFKLYQSASVFLFPSLYEGFGWPVLEAMAFGCPVVCSSAGSLPEVAGNAALTESPENEEGLAKLCIKIIGDPELALELSEKGRLRSQQFSLDRMRKELLDVYAEVLAEYKKSAATVDGRVT